jgi:hypothetical protein
MEREKIFPNSLNTIKEKYFKKNYYDLIILKCFFEGSAVREMRSLHEIPVADFAPLLSRFFFSVKKSNGEDYVPSSLVGML